MPIYDYYCGKCDRSVELLIRGSTIPVCPTCGSDQLEKLVSKPAPHGKTKGIVAEARKQAAREGHFSNYSKSELAKQK